jgi:hypothetical protein
MTANSTPDDTKRTISIPADQSPDCQAYLISAHELREINVLLTAIGINVQADYQWLNGRLKNLQSALRTTERLHRQIVDLRSLLEDIECSGNQ